MVERWEDQCCLSQKEATTVSIYTSHLLDALRIRRWMGLLEDSLDNAFAKACGEVMYYKGE